MTSESLEPREYPESGLISRKDVLAHLDRIANDMADMALIGVPENARGREAMEAALTRAKHAIAFMPTVSVAPPQGAGGDVKDARDAFEAWAEADNRDLAPEMYEERTPDNGLYYMAETTNAAYVGWREAWKALATPSSERLTSAIAQLDAGEGVEREVMGTPSSEERELTGWPRALKPKQEVDDFLAATPSPVSPAIGVDDLARLIGSWVVTGGGVDDADTTVIHDLFPGDYDQRTARLYALTKAVLAALSPQGVQETVGPATHDCDDPDSGMCARCDCWKFTREMCS